MQRYVVALLFDSQDHKHKLFVCQLFVTAIVSMTAICLCLIHMVDCSSLATFSTQTVSTEDFPHCFVKQSGTSVYPQLTKLTLFDSFFLNVPKDLPLFQLYSRV